ncbi:MAG: glycosyltransferase [Proteobacteria bacterium]|nr:glycosyltransferase [Pseudomonadota bacterium]
MISIHQFHYRASAGEAVTQHMLFIREALAEIGIGGKIFSAQRKNLPQGKVQAWSADSAWDCDLLLIHHSQNNPSLKELLSIEVPKAVIYHSQPPVRFVSHDSEAKKSLELGRKQLGILKKRGLPALGVSQFSVSELSQMGFKETGVIPLMHLESQPASKGQLEKNEPKHLLFVGKLAPHKKQSLLIETFFHLRKELPPHSQLHLVGTGDPLYTKYLKLLIKQLGLSQSVILTGKLTDVNLSEYFSLADAFVCMSEYEGFCIPVVEAMKSQVPVFYRPLTGIKETMGGAGVELLTEDPIQNALILKCFLNSPAAMKTVLAKQQGRLKSLSQFQNRKIVQEQLLKLCYRRGEFINPVLTNKTSYDAALTL